MIFYAPARALREVRDRAPLAPIALMALGSQLVYFVVIQLLAGAPDRAIADLEQSAAEAPVASTYFHLAQAHWRARNRSSASQAGASDAKFLHDVKGREKAHLTHTLESINVGFTALLILGCYVAFIAFINLWV